MKTQYIMVISEELIVITEYLTLYTRCRTNRCRYNRSRLYILSFQKRELVSQHEQNTESTQKKVFCYHVNLLFTQPTTRTCVFPYENEVSTKLGGVIKRLTSSIYFP
jgi:hypothetical protein